MLLATDKQFTKDISLELYSHEAHGQFIKADGGFGWLDTDWRTSGVPIDRKHPVGGIIRVG